MFVIFQLGLPTSLANNYSLTNLLRVRQKLDEADNWHCEDVGAIQSRCASPVAVSRLVLALDHITRLLEFNRQKVSSRNVNALGLDTSLVLATRGYLIGPEVPAALIRLAIQKIKIVLSDKESGRVDEIRSRVVVSEEFCAAGTTAARAGATSQQHLAIH